VASTIPAARTALHAGLVALQATTLAGVGVNRTGSWDQRADFDVINVLNARNVSREYPASGATFFTEEYTIPVEVQAFGAGDDITAVETRLWALIAIVEAFVIASGGGRADLGVPGVQTAHPVGLASPGEESGPTDQDVLLAKGTVEIRVSAIVEV
jgi:hypothetical protein